MRTPMFGTRLPRYRTHSGAFDDMVAAQIRRLNGAWPQLVKPVDLELAIRDEVVLRLAELYGRRPDEIDPDWSL